MEMKKSVLAALLLALLAGCSQHDAPLNEKQEQQFATVYTRYLLLCAADTAAEAQRETYLQQALAEAAMPRAEFERVLTAMQRDAAAFSRLMEHLQPVLQKLPVREEPPRPPAVHDEEGRLREPEIAPERR